MLAQRYWNRKVTEQARYLATRSATCGVGDMTFPWFLFHGNLAAASFARKYRAAQLPDYGSTPWQFNSLDLEAKAIGMPGHEIALRIMAECTFRNLPKEVLKFIRTNPFTEKETAALGPLASVLRECIPAQEGATIKFNTVTLRGLLGEAAYAVDLAYEASMNPTGPSATSPATHP